jgi:hypothetical protein
VTRIAALIFMDISLVFFWKGLLPEKLLTLYL